MGLAWANRLGRCAAGFAVMAGLASGGEIGELVWIAGQWTGSLGNARIEEIWAEPRGEAMMGMFRLVEDGQVRFYEFMTIENDRNQLALKLRHFSPGLLAWEEKDAPLSFSLVNHKNRRAVFAQRDSTTRIIYEQQGHEALRVTLEKDKGGKLEHTVFQFERMKQ